MAFKFALGINPLHEAVQETERGYADVTGLGKPLAPPPASTVADRITAAESGGNATAKNPMSSATGAGQFISSTWLSMMRKYRPDLVKGRTVGQVLQLRNNPDLSREMTARYAEENGRYLSDRGIDANAGNTYLAHFLGPEGAARVLKAPSGTPIDRILSADAINANASVLKGKTADQVVAWAAKKMGGSTGPSVADTYARLDEADPGRYAIIDAADVDAWKAKWDDENRSKGILGDTSRLLSAGFDDLALTVREGVRNIPSIGPSVVLALDAIDEWAHGKPSEQYLNDRIERSIATLTPETEAAREKKWWDSENGTLGAAWSDPRSYFAGLVESIPGSAAVMVPAGWLAKGAYAARIAAGFAPQVAAAAAARTALISGALLEGGQGGAQSAASVRREILGMDEATLEASDAMKALMTEGRTFEEARSILADDAASRAFALSGVATGLFGGIGDRVLAKIIAEGIGGSLARRIAEGVARGVVSEGLLEELPQNVGQQIAENIAVRRADPSRSPMEGVGEAAASGLAVGATMGGLLGGGGGAISRAEGPGSAADVPEPNPAAVPAAEPPPAPAGPLGRALAAAPTPEAVVEDVVPVPVSELPPGAPPVGAPVTVTLPDTEPFAGWVDSYENGEAIVVDGVGEVFQVPAEMLSAGASPEAAAAAASAADAALGGSAAPTEPAPVPVAPAAMPAEVPSPETQPQETVESASSRQVGDLKSPSVAEPDAEATPALDRVIYDGKSAHFPDQAHADLYELGVRRERYRRSGGAPARGDALLKDLREKVAASFAMDIDEVNGIADDYRFRVQKKAKGASEPTFEAQRLTRTDPDAAWWRDLSTEERARILKENGVKRTAFQPWHVFSDAIKARLRPFREAAAVSAIDAAANEAATSPENGRPEPTEAQKKAGNYKKGHHNLSGLDITVENPAGSKRKGVAPDGKRWSVTMQSHYGYVRRTEGKDGDHVDVFIKPGTDSLADDAPVFIIDQKKPGNGHFDEHKVMLGFASEDEARAGYLANYAKGWKGLGPVTAMDFAGFKEWLRTGDTTKRAAEAAPTTPAADIGSETAPAPVRDDVVASAVLPAEDTDAEVTVSLTASPPWDFNDTYPAPDYPKIDAALREGRDVFGNGEDGARDVEQVVSVIDEGLTEMTIRLLDIAGAERQIAEIRSGELKLKRGKSPEKEIERLGRSAAEDRRALQDILDAHEDAFSREAVDAMRAEAEARAKREAGQVRIPKEEREPESAADAEEPAPAPTADADEKAGIKRVRATFRSKEWRKAWADNEHGKPHPESPVAFQMVAGWHDAKEGRPPERPSPPGANMRPHGFNPISDYLMGYVAAKEGKARTIRALDAEAEYRRLVGETEPTPQAPATPKKSAQVTATPPATAPVAPPTAPPASTGAFEKNRIFTADKVEAARARLRSKLNQLNSGIDPEVLMDGLVISGAYVEAGVREFAAYADAMVADLGDAVKPYLLSFYEAVRNYPGLDTDGMTSVDEAKRLHGVLVGGGVGEPSPAIGTILPKPKRQKKTGKAGDRTLTQDWGVDHIDAYSAEGEAVKAAFLKDARAYLNAVASILSEQGFTPPTDKKGKPHRAVSVNESGVAGSGDVSLTLAGPDGIGGYVSIGEVALRGVVPTTDASVGVLFRTSTDADMFGTRSQNRWLPTTLSAAELADVILSEVSKEVARGSAELEAPGRSALEGTPAAEVRGVEGGGSASGGADVRRRADVPRGVEPRGGGDDAPAGVGADAGAVPVPAAGSDTDAGKGEQRASDRGEDAGRPAGPVESAARPAAERPSNYVISDDDRLGEGGAKTKFRQNIAAIRLLRDLAGRRATPDEQAILAKYVGWGGIKQVFPREDGTFASGWDGAGEQLRRVLSDAEYEAARASTQNAHYTSPAVVSAIWRGVERLGYRGGRLLEPAVGTGNFLGLMPTSVRQGTQINAVELDRITGGIAAQLYPDANIQSPVGFQDFNAPDGWFDLVIGNPPFGAVKVYDPRRKKISRFSIHNFFFAKSIDLARPDGVVAMVVTNFMMDAARDQARDYIATKTELLGAIRLPNDAFAQNAGTEVTTDIIFLRKLRDGEAPTGETWLNAEIYKDKEGRDVLLNEYYVRHPEQMLGEFGAYGEMYRDQSAALIKRPDQDTEALLNAAIGRLPAAVMPEPGALIDPERPKAPAEAGDAPEGSMFLDAAGTVMIRTEGIAGEIQAEAVDFETEKARERVAGMIRVRDIFTNLRRMQLNAAATDARLGNLRDRLNQAYDAFVAKHGPINLDANKRLFRDDPTWPQLAALEQSFDKGVSQAVAKKTGETARLPSATKAPIFTRRTQAPYSPPTTADSAKDALAATLVERGRVDMAMMERLYGKPEAAIVDELGDLLFRNPLGGYETRDHYLSGNVKQKLAVAERAAADQPEYRRNVDALREAIPADIDAVDIDVKPGAHWLPPRHVAAFADHIAGSEGSAAARYIEPLAKWMVEIPSVSSAAATQWGTDRVGVPEIVNAAVGGRTITVQDRTADGRTVVNVAASEAANAKVAAVADEWRRWIWTDDARRTELHRLYNDAFNTDRPRVYDGAHLTFPGKVGDDIVQLRPHQASMVWRIVQSGTALLDHVVGSGKTFTMVTGAMELRRMGLARKPLFVVPNHLVGQWAADFVRLYPGAKILAASKKDFEAGNRKRLFARVATGDYDAVIVAHSSFGKVAVDSEFHRRFIDEQVAAIEAAIASTRLAEGKRSRTVAQLEKQRDNLTAKWQRLLDSGAKDENLTFEEMGIDALFVDEAHEFKNLAYSTTMQRVAGLGNQTGSQKAADLYMKVQSVLSRTDGRNVVFATGTPISNTMAEMFTMQRYLDHRALTDQGLLHFDAWARMFGEVVTDWELSPSGSYKLNSRFSKFVNMPELMQRYLSFSDVITNDDIKRQLAAQGRTLPLPKVKGGKPQNVVVERSAAQAKYIGEPRVDEAGNESYPKGSLVWRAENLPKGPPQKGDDNMLKIMSDARKAALDMRLIDPGYGDAAGSKVHQAADRIKALYDRWNEQRGTQLVFIDLSTPKNARGREAEAIRALVAAADAGDEAAQDKLDAMSPDEFDALNSDFSVYDDLKQKLVDRGIASQEIAFIHDANTELQKEELFAKVRSGRVRVLFGSTAKMGAGTNVQNRLVGLHHLDAPWRPSDLEQREGRIIRQGNELYLADPEGFEVEILRYATKNTLDARMWQTIEAKARFIEQVRKGNTLTRQIEDVAGEAANAAEMKAAASGNPLILEEMDLRQRLRKLDNARREHDREQHRILQEMGWIKSRTERLEAKMPLYRADAAKAQALPPRLAMTIDGEARERPKDAGVALLLAVARMANAGTDSETIGSYGDFAVRVDEARAGEFMVTLAGDEDHQVARIEDVKTTDPVGLAMRVQNGAKDIAGLAERAAAELRKDAKALPALEAQIRAWQDEPAFKEARERHEKVLAELRPKRATAPAPTPASSGDQARYSTDEPVARLTGDELGVTVSGPQDMPALRKAARDWYDANLRPTPAATKEGVTVRFNRAGRMKTTSKGEALLRAVPAIREIIENGEVVEVRPGNRSEIRSFTVIAAPVEIDGSVRRLAVGLRETPDGVFHYDLVWDNRFAGSRSETEGDQGKASITPALEAAPGEINLFEWPGDFNGADAAGIVAALSGPDITGRLVEQLIDAGQVIIETSAPAGAPAGAQGWTDRSGRIHLVAPALSRGAARPVLLHEAFHAGVRPLLGEQAWSDLMDRLGALNRRFARSTGGARRFYDAARSRVAAAGVTGPLTAEEFGAYAIEEYDAAPMTVRRWVDDMVGAIKAWLLRRFGRQLGQVTPAQLRALAVAALRSRAAMERAAAGANGPLFSTKGPFPYPLGEPVFVTMVYERPADAPTKESTFFATPVLNDQGEYVLRRRFGEDVPFASVGQITRIAKDRAQAPIYERGPEGRVRLRQPATVRAEAAEPENRYSISLPRNRAELNDAISSLAEDRRANLLAVLPLNYLSDQAEPNQAAVDGYLDVKRRMDAYRGQKQHAADDMVQRWRRLASANPAQARALADLMHEATLAQTDPSRVTAEERAKPAYQALRQRWATLSPNMKQLYLDVRDAYKAQTAELDRVILENVRKTMEHGIAAAERDYEREMTAIRDRGLTGKEKEEAEAKAHLRRTTAVLKGRYANKARLTKLRQSFEASRLEGPYFPLGRFGQYFVTVRDVDGTVIDFSRFETEADRRAFVRDMRRDYPQASISTGVLSNRTEVRNAMDPRMLAEITALLGKSNVGEDVMDAIWQRYLQTMPDLSIRKRYIHRKGTAGFHRDALRVYGSHMFHAAHQMGRLKYGPDLEELLEQADEQGRAAPNPINGTKIANELRLRHQWVMNPKSAKWATAATQLGFLWYLGATPAAAAVNLTQTTMIGIPVLGGRYGMTKAAKALGDAFKAFVRGRGSVERSGLSEDEQRAMQWLYDAGALDRSQAHDLAGVAEEGLSYSPLRARVMAKIAWLFHNAERLNREVTALAAYRLARGAGETHEQAVKSAGDLTWKTHFDYSSSNRPRVMQGDVARVALLFRNFQINMLYRIFRDAHQMFRGATPQARKEARLQFAGVMGMMAFHAGVMGTPLVAWLIVPLWSTLFGDPDDPMSSEEQFRRDMIAALGPQIAGIVLDGVPGYVAGISLTDRIGMPDMWFRGDDRDQTAQDWWQTLGLELLGPVFGIGTSVIRGWSIVQDDKGLARGIETASPKAVKDLLRLWRYANEGVLNLKGDPVVAPEDLSAFDLIAQATGFTPAKVAEQYRANTSKKNMEEVIKNRRSRVLEDYWQAVTSGDRAAVNSVLDEIRDFNASPHHAAVRITGETLTRSIATRRRLKQKIEGGVLIQNEDLNRALNQAMPERIY